MQGNVGERGGAGDEGVSPGRVSVTMALVVRARRGRKRAADGTNAVALPAFWAAAPGLLLASEAGTAVQVDGVLLLVFMTRGLLVKIGAELRDWRKKMRDGFGPGPMAPSRVYEMAVTLHHGYVGSAADQDKMLELLSALSEPTAALELYYRHCRSVHVDVACRQEEDLDYLDLFCDARREKLFLLADEGTPFSYTVACTADCLRAHPGLMPAGWMCTNAARDALQIWEGCATDVTLFKEMLAADGAVLGVAKIHLASKMKWLEFSVRI